MAITMGGKTFRYKYDAPFVNGNLLREAFVRKPDGTRTKVFPDQGAEGRYFRIGGIQADYCVHSHNIDDPNMHMYGQISLNGIENNRCYCTETFSYSASFTMVLEATGGGKLKCTDVPDFWFYKAGDDPGDSHVWPSTRTGDFMQRPGIGLFGEFPEYGLFIDGSFRVVESDVVVVANISRSGPFECDDVTHSSWTGNVGFNCEKRIESMPATFTWSGPLGEGISYRGINVDKKLAGFAFDGSVEITVNQQNIYHEKQKGANRATKADPVSDIQLLSETVKRTLVMGVVPITWIDYAGDDPYRASLTGTPTWEVG